MNYDMYFVDGNENLATSKEYNSNNTRQLNIGEIKEKLLTIDYVRNELSEWRSKK